MRNARSPRMACVTHFSTTFDANLCWDNSSTLPRTLFIKMDLSSAFPCSKIEMNMLNVRYLNFV